ncbi:hypothetical protein ACFPN2_03855 [Steroidobacter flavus]|uniref:Tetratricopeptide repeat protein n=1 Tax=Steroidobacter flavus TaxID=1842136 RepID=A0ABV8SKS8_9GAMM
MRPKAAFVAILLGVIALIAVSALWRYYTQPFQLHPFVKTIVRLNLLIEPPERLRKYAQERQILLNREVDSRQPPPQAFLVDAEAVSKSWLLPIAWRSYSESVLLAGGAAYACHQIFLVDGSILKRSAKDFARRMAGFPEAMEERMRDFDSEPHDFLLFTFIHESVHVLDLHYAFNERGQAEIDRLMSSANNFSSRGEFDRERSELNRLLAACPAYYQALDNLGVLERKAGNLEAARHLYEYSLRLKPDNAIGRGNFILLLLQMNDLAAASAHSREYVRLARDNPEAHFWSSIIELKRANLIRAQMHMEVARQRYLATDNPIVIDADVWLLAIAQELGIDDVNARLTDFRADCGRIRKAPAELLQVCGLTDDELKMFSAKVLRSQWVG